MKLFRRKQIGQSLIEVLITVLVVAISAVALVRFHGYLSYDDSLTKQRADATVLAKQQLETLYDFQTKATTAGYTAYADIASGSGTPTVNGTAYTVTWTVTDFTAPDYKNVNISVSWSDRYGSSQSVVLNSDIAGVDPVFSAILY